MSTSKVVMSSDVFFLCLTHALSTEREEIMGLLIGEIDKSETLHISSSILLRRSDKKKDRVEISPEQLTMASTRAETLSEKLGKPMRVLGWYHSHPHITVWPSHIDLRTQATYQLMDKSFVGLIFSVFSQEHNVKSKVSPHQIQLIAFQSVNQSPEGEAPQYEKLDVPVLIEPTPLSPHCLEMLINFPMILCEEEEEILHLTTNFSNQDCLAKLINESVFTRAICHITEIISAPLMQALEGLSKIIDFENERKDIKRAEMELELSILKRRTKESAVTSS